MITVFKTKLETIEDVKKYLGNYVTLYLRRQKELERMKQQFPFYQRAYGYLRFEPHVIGNFSFLLSNVLKHVWDEEKIHMLLDDIDFLLQNYRNRDAVKEFDIHLRSFYRQLHFFRNYLDMMERRIPQLIQDVEDSYDNYVLAKTIHSDIHLSKFISSTKTEQFVHMLENGGYQPKEIFDVLQIIEQHNAPFFYHEKSQIHHNSNILLQHGFEAFPDYHTPNGNVIEHQAKIVVDQIQYSDCDGIMELLSNYSHFDKEDFLCFMTNILQQLQELLFQQLEMLQDHIFFVDMDIRQEVISQMKALDEKYVIVRRYFDEQVSTYSSNEGTTKKAEESINRIFYPTNQGKSPVLRDLKKIPEEYLGKVLENIEKLKSNQLSPKMVKRITITGINKRAFYEILDDQVLILFSSLGNRAYQVSGIGIKKSDIAASFNTFMERPIVDIKHVILEEQQEIDEQIKTYCFEKARRGSR